MPENSTIYLDAPNVGALEKKYLSKAIDSGYVSTAGPFVPEFEERFAGSIGAARAVATQSGTSAIHLALHELGIGKGDEVIVPALTFIATVNPVLYAGATPVFADVDLTSWNIDPLEIKRKITRRTKAVIPVHFYGNPSAMDAIMRIAREHGLFVIEDAAQSFGASYGGKPCGLFGDLGCFSFNGNKVITTGGGGMIVGKSKKRLAHIKFLANQARSEKTGYVHPEMGFNYRMTNLEAALGLAQLERAQAFLKSKKRYNALYRKELGSLRQVVFQAEYPGAKSSLWLTSVIFKGSIRVSRIAEELKKAGVPSRRIYAPIPDLPPFKKFRKGSYPNAQYIFERGLSLPSSTLNRDEDICRVCARIKEIIRGGSRP